VGVTVGVGVVVGVGVEYGQFNKVPNGFIKAISLTSDPLYSENSPKTTWTPLFKIIPVLKVSGKNTKPEP
jgi:hypothetical protein